MGAENTPNSKISVPRMMAWLAHELLSNPRYASATYQTFANRIAMNDDTVSGEDFSDSGLRLLNGQLPLTFVRVGDRIRVQPLPLDMSSDHPNHFPDFSFSERCAIMEVLVDRLIAQGRNEKFNRKLALLFKMMNTSWFVTKACYVPADTQAIAQMLFDHGLTMQIEYGCNYNGDATVHVAVMPVEKKPADAVPANALLKVPPPEHARDRLRTLLLQPHKYHVIGASILAALAANPDCTEFPIPAKEHWPVRGDRALRFALFEHHVLSDEFCVMPHDTFFTIKPYARVCPWPQPRWYWELMSRLQTNNLFVTAKYIRAHCLTKSVSNPIPMPDVFIPGILREALGDEFELVCGNDLFLIVPCPTSRNRLSLAGLSRLCALFGGQHDYSALALHIMQHFAAKPGDAKIPYPAHGEWNCPDKRAELLARFENAMLRNEFVATPYATYFTIESCLMVMDIEQPVWHARFMQNIDASGVAPVLCRHIRAHCRTASLTEPIGIPPHLLVAGTFEKNVAALQAALKNDFSIHVTCGAFKIVCDKPLPSEKKPAEPVPQPAPTEPAKPVSPPVDANAELVADIIAAKLRKWTPPRAEIPLHDAIRAYVQVLVVRELDKPRAEPHKLRIDVPLKDVQAEFLGNPETCLDETKFWEQFLSARGADFYGVTGTKELCVLQGTRLNRIGLHFTFHPPTVC